MKKRINWGRIVL